MGEGGGKEKRNISRGDGEVGRGPKEVRIVGWQRGDGIRKKGSKWVRVKVSLSFSPSLRGGPWVAGGCSREKRWAWRSLLTE